MLGLDPYIYEVDIKVIVTIQITLGTSYIYDKLLNWLLPRDPMKQ